MALSNDLPTRRPNLDHMGRGGAGEQQVFGGYWHQGIVVKAIKIKDQQVCRHPNLKHSTIWQAKGSTPCATGCPQGGCVSYTLIVRITWTPPKQVKQAQLAKAVIVFIQGAAIKPHRHRNTGGLHIS